MGKSDKQDTQKETYKKEIQNLKSKNRNLQKRIKVLKKELSKYKSLEENYFSSSESEEESPPQRQEKNLCPHCQNPLRVITLGVKFEVYICNDCNYRKSANKE